MQKINKKCKVFLTIPYFYTKSCPGKEAPMKSLKLLWTLIHVAVGHVTNYT